MDERNELIKSNFRKIASSKGGTNGLVQWLLELGESRGAKTQLAVADMLMDDNGGNCTFADAILARQAEKIAQWGDKAFPLSERQCQAIAREFQG